MSDPVSAPAPAYRPYTTASQAWQDLANVEIQEPATGRICEVVGRDASENFVTLWPVGGPHSARFWLTLADLLAWHRRDTDLPCGQPLAPLPVPTSDNAYGLATVPPGVSRRFAELQQELRQALQVSTSAELRAQIAIRAAAEGPYSRLVADCCRAELTARNEPLVAFLPRTPFANWAEAAPHLLGRWLVSPDLPTPRRYQVVGVQLVPQEMVLLSQTPERFLSDVRLLAYSALVDWLDAETGRSACRESYDLALLTSQEVP